MHSTPSDLQVDKKKKRPPVKETVIYLICVVIAFLLFSFFTDAGIDLVDLIGSGTGTGEGSGTGSGIGDGAGPESGGGSGGGRGEGIGKGNGTGSGKNNADGEGRSSSNDEGDGEDGGGAEETPEEENSTTPDKNTPDSAEADEASKDKRSPELPANTSDTADTDDSQPANEETDEDDAEEMVIDVSEDKWEPSTIRIGEKKDEPKKKARKKSVKRVASKGKTSGRKGSGGGGGGGRGRKRKVYTKTVGGIKVVASKLGVVLDVSGSMTAALPILRKEIDEKFKGSTYFEVVGCRLYTGKEQSGAKNSLSGKKTLGGAVSLGGARADLGGLAIKKKGKSRKVLKAGDTLTAMLRLIRGHSVDAIYWFCDLQDGETPDALQQLEKELKRYGVRLYVNSVGQNPRPGLSKVIEKSEGSFARFAR